MSDPTRLKPSEVFAVRLRETRIARRISQTELARLVTERGVPMSKAAVLRVENRERGLSLDEALALTMALNAVPAYLLSPPEGTVVAVNDSFAMDGAGIREWLRYGLWNWEPAPDEGHEDGKRHAFQRNLAALALALVDAVRGNDKAGLRDAERSIIREVARRQKELEIAQEEETADAS